MSMSSSPCTGVCAIDGPSGLCRGCGRRLDEIAAWAGLPEADRLRIMAILPARLAAVRVATAATLDAGHAEP